MFQLCGVDGIEHSVSVVGRWSRRWVSGLLPLGSSLHLLSVAISSAYQGMCLCVIDEIWDLGMREIVGLILVWSNEQLHVPCAGECGFFSPFCRVWRGWGASLMVGLTLRSSKKKHHHDL